MNYRLRAARTIECDGGDGRLNGWPAAGGRQQLAHGRPPSLPAPSAPPPRSPCTPPVPGAPPNMYVCMYIRIYTYYVLIQPTHAIYYVLAAVFASCFFDTYIRMHVCVCVCVCVYRPLYQAPHQYYIYFDRCIRGPTWSASSFSRPCHPLAAVVQDTFLTASCTAGWSAGGGCSTCSTTPSATKDKADSSGNMHLSCCLGFRV